MTGSQHGGQIERRTASCQCGAVTLEMIGKPIVAATCYCHSCQTAGKAFWSAFRCAGGGRRRWRDAACAELAEAPFLLLRRLKTKTPFDKLRASGTEGRF